MFSRSLIEINWRADSVNTGLILNESTGLELDTFTLSYLSPMPMNLPRHPRGAKADQI